jgi:hypothetical protein
MQPRMGSTDSLEKFRELWCILVHSSTSWPMNGRYRCRVCGRWYRIPWANHEIDAGWMSPPVGKVPANRALSAREGLRAYEWAGSR